MAQKISSCVFRAQNHLESLELVCSGIIRGFDATLRVWSGCPGYDESGELPNLLWQMLYF